MQVIRPCHLHYPRVCNMSIPVGHLPADKLQPTISGMDKYEHRRQRLGELLTIPPYAGRGGQARLSAKTGVDASYISRLLYEPGKPGAKRLAEDTIEAIEKGAGLPKGWFDMQVGIGLEIPSAPESSEHSLTTRIKDKSEIYLEQFDTGGAMGHGVLLRDQPGVIKSWHVSQEWLNRNVRFHSGAQNLRIVTGFGDSMKPTFNPGDPLIVDTGFRTVDVETVYFFRVGDEGFIKRLQRIPGEGIRVISDNKKYESWTIRPDMDFEVFGRVLKVWC